MVYRQFSVMQMPPGFIRRHPMNFNMVLQGKKLLFLAVLFLYLFNQFLRFLGVGFGEMNGQ